MKKKMILPMVLVMGMAVAPMPKAKAAIKMAEIKDALKKIELITPLLNQLKNISEDLLGKLGLEATAVGFEEIYKSMKDLTAELDKPLAQMDLTKILALAKRINDIGKPLSEDLRNIIKNVLKPVKTILPRKTIKIGKKDFFVDDIPYYLVDQLFMLTDGYLNLADKVLSNFVKVKEKIEPGAAMVEEVEVEVPGKRIIEMD